MQKKSTLHMDMNVLYQITFFLPFSPSHCAIEIMMTHFLVGKNRIEFIYMDYSDKRWIF